MLGQSFASWRVFLGILLLCGSTHSIFADESPGSLDETVARQLVEQLQTGDPEARNKAETKLTAMGPQVLPLLPEVTASTSGETKQRLSRIRSELQKQRVELELTASRVTLTGSMTLSEAFEKIAAQTGNQIVDYRQRFGQPAREIKLELDIRDQPFWPAFDQLLDQADLTTNEYVGELRKLAIVAASDSQVPRSEKVSYDGLFRIGPKSMFVERNLRNPENSSFQLLLELAWEPRVVPILIRVDLSKLKATCDNGSTVAPISTGSVQLPIQTGVATLDLGLPLELPEREAKTISIQGELSALVPGGKTEFEFTNLATARGVSQSRGNLTVQLDGVRRNGNLQQVSVRLRMNQPGDALQSHLDWVSDNEAVLVSPDGVRLDQPNLEKYLERENEVGYSYLFIAPADLTGYKFVYTAPSGMVEVPVTFELQNLQLP